MMKFKKLIKLKTINNKIIQDFLEWGKNKMNEAEINESLGKFKETLGLLDIVFTRRRLRKEIWKKFWRVSETCN